MPGTTANPPPSAALPRLDTPTASLSWETLELLERFRTQIHALGALWILIGALAAAGGAYLLFWENNPGFLTRLGQDPPTLMVWILEGCLWIAVGTLTALKNTKALIVGLTLTYLALAFSLMRGAPVGAFTLPAIIQAHRVRAMSRALIEDGIPLTTRP